MIEIQKNKKIVISRYFSSVWWIENLGVVPFFTFLIFLFFPAFFFLMLRRLFKIFELETILQLLSLISYYSNIGLLHRRMQSVKKILLCLAFYPYGIFASGNLDKNIQFQNVIISRGEHKEFKFPNLSKFTVGNPDIVKHKYYPKKKELLIKGNKIGFTELVIWPKKNKKSVYRIYVLSKRKQLKILHLAQTIKSLGLNTNIAGPLIIISGTVSDYKNYELLKKIYKQNEQHLHLKGNLSSGLRNQIIGEIYYHIFNENIDHIKCYDKYFDIFCTFEASNSPSKKLLKHLQNQYLIHFIPVHNNDKKNYLLKLKIIQIEKLDGRELDLGLSSLTGSLDNIFTAGIKGIIKNNNIILSNKKIHISTLAQPEIILQAGKSTKVEIGSEISYPLAQIANGVQTIHDIKWKFSGLKVTLKLIRIGNKLQIDYTTYFSRPSQGNSQIAGSKEKSSALITLKRPLQLFQIGFKTVGNDVRYLPWLGKIPILGELFKSKSDQSNFKKVTGIIVLEEHGP